jgi:hypothetical protein
MQEIKTFEVWVAYNGRTFMRTFTNKQIGTKFEKWDWHTQGVLLFYTALISVMKEKYSTNSDMKVTKLNNFKSRVTNSKDQWQ